MKKWNRYIFYLIGATLLLTVGVQSYWNYKNYKQNKRHVIREIRHCLNDAVQEYFALEMKKSTISITTSNTVSLTKKNKPKTVGKVIDLKIDSTVKNISYIRTVNLGTKDTTKNQNEIKVVMGHKIPKDQINLTSVIFAILKDSINFKQLDSVFKAQLLEKNIALTYNLQFWKDEKLAYESNKHLVKNDSELHSNSGFLKPKERLILRYNVPTGEILLRSLWGILFSVFLVLAILGSLWYLLHIIRQQKQISEMKNDLISNITHEFKTPIATASAAIEAMQNFNVLEDKNKTETYLKMSENQLKKLHTMVEKLLETASLDSAVISLQKENVDLVAFLHKQRAKFATLTEKTINFETELTDCQVNVDRFHFENVVGNIIDNAIKYGGDQIRLSLRTDNQSIYINFADNGNGIATQHRQRIFDKFYRISKGNRHDVKGFGIGLYYAGQIVKKHGGVLALLPDKNETIFSIKLPR